MNIELTEKGWQGIIQSLQGGDNEPYWSQVVNQCYFELAEQLCRKYHCDFEKAHGVVIDFFIRFRNGLIEGKYYGAYKKLYAFCWIAVKNDYMNRENKQMKWHNYLERIIHGADYESYHSFSPSTDDEVFLTNLIHVLGKAMKITCDKCLDAIWKHKVLHNTLKKIYQELEEPNVTFDAWRRNYHRCLKRLKGNAAILLDNSQKTQSCKKVMSQQYR